MSLSRNYSTAHGVPQDLSEGWVGGGVGGETKQRQQLLCATSVSENILRWNTSMWTNRTETNPVVLIYCFLHSWLEVEL